VNRATDPATLRERHEHAVLSNSLRLDHRWGRQCRAFNLYIVLEQAAVAALGEVQREVLVLEPLLLRVPPPALHVSVAWLIPVHQEDAAVPKDAQWARRGRHWCAEIRTVLAGLAPFDLTYTSLIATDSAVIASAEPRDIVNRLRSELVKRLMLPDDLNRGELVHTTLFRYSAPLAQPERLLRRLSRMHLRIGTRVSELTVVREEVFPSLQTQVLGRYHLTASSR
jgi:hypothetical protein